MSGVPMSSDRAHAFSGGALSEREVVSSAVGPKEGHQSNAVSVPRTSGSAFASRSESVTHHEAAPALGGTGMWRVLELPATIEVALFPTLEAAQAYALAMNLWVDQRPDPDDVRPFFRAPDLRAEPDLAQLDGILARMLRPETP